MKKQKTKALLIFLLALMLVVVSLTAHLAFAFLFNSDRNLLTLITSLICVGLLMLLLRFSSNSKQEQAKKEYYQVIGFLGDAVLELSFDTNTVKYVNEHYSTKMQGKKWDVFLDEETAKMKPGHAEIYRQHLATKKVLNAVKEGGKSFLFQGVDVHNFDKNCWYKCEIRPADDEGKKAYIVYKNVEKEKQLQDDAILRAETDGLTGLYNRNTFEEKVAFALSKKKEGQQFAFFVVNIDDFKLLNEREGHPVGDKVLQLVATQIKQIFLLPCVLGRIVGDEFCIFVPICESIDGIKTFAARICDMYKTFDYNGIKISGSVGICLCPRDGTTFQSLYDHSDIALYQAKIEGKNRYCFFDGLRLDGDTRATLARMRQRGTLATQPRRFEEYNFLEFVFASLNKKNVLTDTMIELLEFFVRYFAINCAYLLEPSTFTKLYNVSYEWCQVGCKSATRQLQGISCESTKYLAARLLKNGVYHTESFAGLPQRMQEIFKEFNSTGLVLIPLSNDGKTVSGIIILEERIRKNFVGREELRALRLAGRAISSYLAQNRATKLTNENFATTKTIIDTVPGEIYVVDKNDYSLLFYNQEAALSANKAAIALGEKCHKAFFDMDTPCKGCPITQIPLGKTETICSFYNKALAKKVRMMATETRWKDGFGAYLLTGYDKMETADELEQRRKDKRYRLALRDIYDFVCEIDLQAGDFQVFTRSKDTRFVLPDKGFFEIEIEKLIQHKVVLDDAKKLAYALTLENLRTLKRAENKEINVDFCVFCDEDKINTVWYNISAALAPGENGATDTVMLFARKIEEEKRIEALEISNQMLLQQLEYRQQLQQKDRRYKLILKQTGAIVFEHRAGMGEQFVSPRIFDALAISPNQLELQNENLFEAIIKHLVHPSDKKDFIVFKEKVFVHGLADEITVRLLAANLQYRFFKIAVTFTQDEQSNTRRYLGTILDVNTQTEAFNTLKYRAEYDTLTGIYNYLQFCTLAQKSIEENPKISYAILSLDIDKFKLINDIHGIAVGDEALCYIGSVLLKYTPANSICGRIHSDVFCVLFQYNTNEDIIAFTKLVSDKIKCLSQTLQLAAFFGVYPVQDSKTPISLMVDRAHLAKRAIKGSVVQNYQFYEDDLRANLVEEKGIEKDMYSGLENHEFVVYYQPKLQLRDNSICGVEALVRWRHPTKGFLAPARFIGVFERNGFISKLDRYVWEQACQTLQRWKKENRPLLPISVNVSRVHINTINFVEDLLQLVKKYDVEPNLLHLEITETLFFENDTKMYTLMDSLQKAGFLLEMDDFGSGYSSLNMLRNVPINTIKIDKAFLDDTLATDRGQVVVRHTVSMAKELNLKVIAEGVETLEQMEFLRQIDCDDIQGFYIAKPMPIEEFEQMLLTNCII